MSYTPENNPYIPGDPYSYDLKWIVDKLKEAIALYAPLSNDFAELKDYVENYFANLDLSQEVSDKVDEMASNGYFDQLIYEIAITDGNLAGFVTSWLNDNVNPVGSAVVVDDTLTIAGAAADAKKTGVLLDTKLPRGDYYDQAAFTQTNTHIGWTGGGTGSDANYSVLPTQIIPSDSDGYIYYRLYDSPTNFALFTFYSNDPITHITNSGIQGQALGGYIEGKYQIPAGAKFYRAMCWNNGTDQYVIVGRKIAETSAQNKERTEFIPSAIFKQNPYSTGNAGFYGDSIVRGYDPNAQIVSAPWPNQLKTALGMPNAANLAVGGAGFVAGSTVLSQLQGDNQLSSRTHIFIGAGTNDYWYYKYPTEFSTAVDNVITYLQANAPTASVIFITPINRSTHPNVAVMTLNEYRNIIAEKALAAGYSVIDGRKLPFPQDDVTSNYAIANITDGLHPTQLGYNNYAAAMYDLLAGKDA